MSVQVLADEHATETLGADLGAALSAFARPLSAGPLVVYLEGALGAGKTTVVRGLLRALGHRGDVTSPTYSLYEEYELGDLHCVHCDFYRIGQAEELDYLGLRDLLDEHTLMLVEWPAIAAGHLPPPDLEISLDYAGAAREARVDARSPSGERWLGQYRRGGSKTGAGAGSAGENLM